jgi:hypothetical protein
MHWWDNSVFSCSWKLLLFLGWRNEAVNRNPGASYYVKASTKMFQWETEILLGSGKRRKRKRSTLDSYFVMLLLLSKYLTLTNHSQKTGDMKTWQPEALVPSPIPTAQNGRRMKFFFFLVTTSLSGLQLTDRPSCYHFSKFFRSQVLQNYYIQWSSLI